MPERGHRVRGPLADGPPDPGRPVDYRPVPGDGAARAAALLAGLL
ncbi:hypothetical protein [Planobispora rosea]|nr:hypothetical protein [Planobispora rosea]